MPLHTKTKRDNTRFVRKCNEEISYSLSLRTSHRNIVDHKSPPDERAELLKICPRNRTIANRTPQDFPQIARSERTFEPREPFLLQVVTVRYSLSGEIRTDHVRIRPERFDDLHLPTELNSKIAQVSYPYVGMLDLTTEESGEFTRSEMSRKLNCSELLER